MTDTAQHLSSGSWPVTDDAIRDVFALMLADGSWGRYHGPHGDALRKALAEYHDIEHVILCCSGTAAVELALRSVPVGTGDEVILAAYDFKANFVNVLTVGAVPVLIDTLPDVPILDVDQLAGACTERTRAIIVSHLHGSLAPVEKISEFARARNIAVIEDACQCPGARIGRRRAGSLGDIGVLSFGGSKLLTSGRGGAVLTSNTAMAQRIKLFTQRGNDAYPLSEMQAAVLLPQLNQLDTRNLRRIEFANRLEAALKDQDGLRSAIWPELSGGHSTELSSDCQPAIYKMAFRLAERFSAEQRKSACLAARDVGVPVDPGFHALHLIHSQRRFRAVGDLPNATALHDRLVVLHHTALEGDEALALSVAGRLRDSFNDCLT
jgi:dTDP-4-amino-4,6-dideoxygalactose transaminase